MLKSAELVLVWRFFETRRKVPVSLRKIEDVESSGTTLKLHKRRTIMQRRVKAIEYRILQFVLSRDDLAELAG